jgi:hypothetical protein
MWSIFSNRSSSWKTCRNKFLQDHPCCAACGRQEQLEVHHIEPVHIAPEKEVDHNNLITLCRYCHFYLGHFMDWTSWNPNIKQDADDYSVKRSNRPVRLGSQSLNNQKWLKYLWWTNE